MDLTGSLIKNTYGNVLTLGTVAGTPTSGTLQNGAGQNVTSLTLQNSLVLGLYTAVSISSNRVTLGGAGHINTQSSFRIGGGSESSFGFGVASDGQVDKLVVYPDDYDVWGQRRGVNPQTFNLYNTYTDASNYERGFLKWDTNVIKIGTEALGTGTQRAVEIVGTELTTPSIKIGSYGAFSVTGGNTLHIGSSSGSGKIAITSGDVRIASNYELNFSNSTNASAQADAGLRRVSAGIIQITDGDFSSPAPAGLQFGYSQASTDYTVATLPTPTVGMIARVTDGDAALTFGNTVVNSGAGATPYLCWYNGSNWTVIGA